MEALDVGGYVLVSLAALVFRSLPPWSVASSASPPAGRARWPSVSS
ncbi:hypothetical protein BAURA86_04102 [Brevibacterium aurantiacum]|uniref:Uncharacterized protein n=1 Tax=Brevibacterium aurantiacum TaxID=273384 RepID=A0A2H1L1W8_BREAU|nr:hypothetical protein BAURA86_04102 [Brevibacterium aurantiacum]